MDDLISRQAVLDILDRHTLSRMALYEIEDLPSVNPVCEPCEDAISRRAAVSVANDFDCGMVVRGLEKLPSVQPAVCIAKISFDDQQMKEMVDKAKLEILATQPEQKEGKWIPHEVKLPDRTILNYTCSACGRKLIGYGTETLSEVPYCHCGAKMREGK